MKSTDPACLGPDFLCIGASKTATSWLHSVLYRVPGVFLPVIKEVFYFNGLKNQRAQTLSRKYRGAFIDRCRDELEAMGRDDLECQRLLKQLEYLDSEQNNDAWYRGIFGFANDEDICGEICPAYMTNVTEPDIDRIFTLFPQVRILVHVRDPIDRAWSHLRMNIKNGEFEYDLDTFVSDKMVAYLYQCGDYAAMIPWWKSHTLPGHFHTIVYDRVEAEPESVLKEVLEFIGLPDGELPKEITTRINPGREWPLPIELRARLFDAFEPQYAFLSTMFPAYVESWLDRHRAALGIASSSQSADRSICRAHRPPD